MPLEDQLERLEAVFSQRQDYKGAQRLVETSSALRAKRAAATQAKERTDTHAQAREYDLAARAQVEESALAAELAAQEEEAMTQYGAALRSLPSSVAVEPIPAVATLHVPNYSTSTPVTQGVVVSNVQPVVMGSRQRDNRQPLLANGPIVNGVQAPPGGIWTEEQYTGPCTFCFGFWISPLAMICPCDTRRVYVSPNGVRFPEVGNGWRNALIILWLINVVLFFILVINRASSSSSDGGVNICDDTYGGDHIECSNGLECCLKQFAYDNSGWECVEPGNC
uniref:Uncharacterized protein n=1 Tax=Haptolina ericina TaxID=156174 RepID=A0A7S3AHK5_9EUKA